MRPVQLVLDEALLERVDHFARRRKVTRSAFLREALTETLDRLQIAEQVEAIREAHRAMPETKEERATARALQRSQGRLLRRLATGERW